MLRIHETAVKAVAMVVPLLGTLERVDPDLARQIRRSVMSTPLNVAEGSAQTGRRRTQHYRIALGSARETWSALTVAAAAGYLPMPSAELKDVFDKVIGTLHKCVHRPPTPAPAPPG